MCVIQTLQTHIPNKQATIIIEQQKTANQKRKLIIFHGDEPTPKKFFIRDFVLFMLVDYRERERQSNRQKNIKFILVG